MYSVWPWRPVGDGRSPLDPNRRLQSNRGLRVGGGCPSPEMRERVKKLMNSKSTKTVDEKLLLKLPLTELDTDFDGPDSRPTFELLGFEASDFYYRRSEDNNPDDDEFKQAVAAGWFINDVAEQGDDE